MAAIPLARFSLAARERLVARIKRASEAAAAAGATPECIRQAELELGRLIHQEAAARYHQAECPPALQAAPWLYVIGKLVEENPCFAGEAVREDLRRCVELYIFSLQSGTARTA